jgi:transcriptional antiterminator NusG
MPSKMKWYVIQTMSGQEDSVIDLIKSKRDTLGLNNLIGEVVSPEDVIIDHVVGQSQTRRYYFTNDAEIYKNSGDEITKGELLGKEPDVFAMNSGEIVSVEIYKTISVATKSKIEPLVFYRIPASLKLEKGLKAYTTIYEGLPLTTVREEEYFSRHNGLIYAIDKTYKLIVKNVDSTMSEYYIISGDNQKSASTPFKVKDKIEKGQLLGKGKRVYTKSDGIVDIIPRRARKELIVKKITKKKNFPGYVFIEARMNRRIYDFLNSTSGVIKILSKGRQPQPLNDDKIKDILIPLAERRKAKRMKSKISFQTGDLVKIEAGSFAGFEGVISEVDHDKGEVKVLLKIFGRETPVMVDAKDIKTII